MIVKRTNHTFIAKVWLYSGSAAVWHFVSVPKVLSLTLKKKHGMNAKGWGSLPVEVTIGKTVWKTSVFPDSKSGMYLLPLKVAVCRKEGLFSDDSVKVSLVVR